MNATQKQLLRITRIIPEAVDAKTFILDGKPVPYITGQFLTFIFAKSNGTEERRNYSISSTPEHKALQITVKRVANGEYSRWLIDLAKEGDELFTIGASGFFTLPENVQTYDQLIFFAAGSGITPVYALITGILFNYTGIRVVLIYSNTNTESTIFYNLLKDLQRRFQQQLTIEFLFSADTEFPRKRLGVHLLEKIIEQQISGDAMRKLFYLCGPFEYMQMITIVLRNHGFPASHIRKEIFNIEKTAGNAEPPDKDPHEIYATLNGKEYRFHSQYPETILQTAKALKIPMPYSCEAGQCGTCAATCIAGNVWMRHNDVLLDEEIQRGRILTCTGYAIGGDVVLAY